MHYITLLAAINQRTNKALPPNPTCRPAHAIAHGLSPRFVGLQFAPTHLRTLACQQPLYSILAREACVS